MQIKYSKTCKGLKSIAVPQIPFERKKNQKLEKIEIRKLELKCLDYNYNIMYKSKQSESIEF